MSLKKESMSQTSKSKDFKNLYDEFTTSLDLEEEFEVRFGTKGTKKTTKIDFDNIIAYLKAKGFEPYKKDTTHTLKIQFEYTNPNTGKTQFSPIRVEIDGAKNISEYCKTNTLYDGTKYINGLTFREKKSKKRADGTIVHFVENNDFNFRVSYQSEKVLKQSSPIIQNIVNKWSDRKKLFRLIERYTFVHKSYSNLYIDMSVVKSSKLNERYNLIPAYTVEESDVFNSPLTYEVEVEINKKNIMKYMFEEYFNFLKTTIKYILCGYQQTNYPVSYSEMKDVLQEYMKLIYDTEEEQQKRVKSRNFIGPSSITLEMKNIQPLTDDMKIPNIRMPYSVTDKADGLRKLLYVAKNGNIYFIDTNMNVQFTGSKTSSKDHLHSILDGEHILHDKNGKYINLFACFDIYFINKEDKRALPFIDIDSDSDIDKGLLRLYLLNSFIRTINAVPISSKGTPLRIEAKTFYASSGKIGQHTIFDSCNKVMERVDSGLLEYETDGLIFTPTELGVGQESKEDPITNYKKTWMYSFKWKPTEHNSVDFLVTTKKDQQGKDVINTIFEDGVNNIDGSNLTQYKTLVLRVGFDENVHGYINPCNDLIQNKIPKVKGLDNEETYKPMPFYPYNPSNTKASICNIVLKNISDSLYMTTETKDSNESEEVFEDNMIVEFRYDITEKDGWKWKPIKVRYDKTAEYRSGIRNYGNAFHVAQSVWASIHNPITKSMLVTGLNIPDYEEDEDVYYNRTGKTYTREMRDFHNLYVKNKLIKSVSKRGNTLYDLAVGKGGDIKKWIDANLRFVFGVDISKDNIENRKDGACARYLNYAKQYKNIPKAHFVNANSSLNIRDGTGVFSEKGKEIVNAIFGEGPRDKEKLGEGVYNQYGVGKDGFNVVSVQFALHYFFQNKSTLHNFIRNVSEGCAVGGYFIGTSYDGKKVFNQLRTKKVGESLTLMEKDYKMWEMTKMYESEDFPDDESSLGYRIDVYQESINKTFPEYLVNFDYFDRVLMNYGFELVTRDEAKQLGLPNSTGLFNELFVSLKEEVKSETRGSNKGKTELETGRALHMDKDENQKFVSFLNRYFVYKKVRNIDPSKVENVMSKTLPQQEEIEKSLTEDIQKIAKTIEKTKKERKPRKKGKLLLIEE
jgi:hypothetical protein